MLQFPFHSITSCRVFIPSLFSKHYKDPTPSRISQNSFSFSTRSLSTKSSLLSTRQHHHHHLPLPQHQPQCYFTLQQSNSKYFSRFSANNIMTGTDTFRISDYDVIGFDLDNTLLRYKVSAMVQLEYDCLAQYLVNVKGYSPKHLLKPLKDDLDFLQKGLILDLARGNVLKLSATGFIRKAAHGTRFMEDDEIRAVYGEERKWDLLVDYMDDMLLTWNGPLATSMRSLLDYFDMPASLVFARCVDTFDEEKGRESGDYGHWKDILEGIHSLYSPEHFQANDSPYFEELKSNLPNYVHKTDQILIDYLKQLKTSKTTFLLTGSHVDFANLTASRALGDDWKDLFDFVGCFAKKPGFFVDTKPFYKLNGTMETETILAKDINPHDVYIQGNIQDLLQVLRKSPNAVDQHPKVLYVGDNLIQDVYTPNVSKHCDTIAVSEELLAEGIRDCDQNHVDASLLTSQLWGSYFGSACDPTLWSEVIRKNARLCVADVANLAHQPLDFEYKCFTGQLSCANGFFPSEPANFYKK